MLQNGESQSSYDVAWTGHEQGTCLTAEEPQTKDSCLIMYTWAKGIGGLEKYREKYLSKASDKPKPSW